MNYRKESWNIMRRKGFTLIELLEVIVILAIIALIATPIVLDIIKDSKVSSKKIKNTAINQINFISLLEK